MTIGQQYSVVVYLSEKENKNSPPWVLPLACHRVTTDEKGLRIGMQQISQCIQSQEAFKNKLCVVASDSAYGNPACLAETTKNLNQVQISFIFGGV